jgi:hypothetical protein
VIIATAWNNGQHHRSGAGYGLKISVADRHRHFHRSWKSVQLLIPGAEAQISVNVDKASFWGESCRELISAKIGRWMIKGGLTPWPEGRPPKFELILVEPGVFALKRADVWSKRWVAPRALLT